MSIQPTVHTGVKAYSQTSSDNKTAAKTASEMSAENKQQLNRTILESQLSISVKSDNKSMTLLYRSLTDAISGKMAEDSAATKETGAPGEPKYQDEDTSPKATAERIVAFATRFYEAYQKNHPELQGEDALNGFLDLMKGAIDKGFGDARKMLDGMQQLQGKVATDIDDTYGLVQSGLEDFRKRQLEAMKTAAKAAANNNSASSNANNSDTSGDTSGASQSNSQNRSGRA